LVGFLFKSFGDAPEGIKEEIKDTYAVGAEYSYQDSFALRLDIFMKVLKRSKKILL
jgi:hypothetical protein